MNIEQMTQKTRELCSCTAHRGGIFQQRGGAGAPAGRPCPAAGRLIPQLLQTLGIDANAFAQAALQKVEALPRVTGSGRDPEKIYISNDLDRASTPPSSRPSR